MLNLKKVVIIVPMKPLVSVVMSVFNADMYVKRAIESILTQTLKNFEFIIINDASKDKSLGIIRSYMRKDKRIRLISNKNDLKLAHSLNIGVAHAKADLIARMDPDDISLPERLETQYLYLKNHPEVAIVGTNISIMNSSGKEISKREYPTQSEDIKSTMLRYAPFAHPTVMYRKNVFLELGGYNQKIKLCEDVDFWFRIGTKYKFGNIPKKLLKYTLSNTSHTQRNLRQTELFGFKLKIDAVRNLGYKPTLYDIIYNILQFLTLWIMSPRLRVKVYNAIRSRGLI